MQNRYNHGKLEILCAYLSMDYKDRAKVQKSRRRFEAREMIHELKTNTPCADCNHPFHPCQMDVARKDGSKSIQLSRVLHKSQKFIAEELKKCDFVCSNCNRLRTWEFQRKVRMEDND
jgi:hypothetical protein